MVVVQASELDTPELSIDVCLELMTLHTEATERALKLSAPGQAARNCRMLFHHLVPQMISQTAAAAGSEGVGESVSGPSGPGAAAAAAVVPAAPAAHPGCLLEQLAR